MSYRIEYQFHLPKGEAKSFNLDFDSDFGLAPPALRDRPAWTDLEYEKCRHCPLDQTESPSCPLALQLVPLLDFAADLFSFEQAKVEIKTPQRVFVLNGPLQRGLSSLMGLIIPASGCPHTAVLRPLARYHLPNANRNETMVRVLSTFLLASKMAQPVPEKPWETLLKIYKNLHIMNEFLVRRLRAACEKDSTLNALIILDAFTFFVPMELEDSLSDMRPFLAPMIEAIEALNAQNTDES